MTDTAKSEYSNSETLKEFRGKYGVKCEHEDIYLAFVKDYDKNAVQAFLDYVLSAERIDINNAIVELERFFQACIVEPGFEQQSEFNTNEEIINFSGFSLNMSYWENSHIQCSSCEECIEKSRNPELSESETVRFLNKALEYDPNSEEALLERASQCESLGYYNDAITDLKHYISIAGDEDYIIDSSLQLIDLHILSKKYELGIDLANKFMKQYPADEYFLFGRAKLYRYAGMLSEAKTDLKKLEELGHGAIEVNLKKMDQHDAWL